MSRTLLFLALFMIGGLWGCLDHQIPSITPGSTTPRLRVKTLTLELPDKVAKVSSFNYDTQGRLNLILIYQTPDSTVSEMDYNYYSYDEQNRFTGYRRAIIHYPRGSRANSFDGYTYTYNDAGKVRQILHTNGYALGLTYDSNNQLISANRSFGVSGLTIRGSDNFTFTGNNLTSYRYSTSITGMGGPAFGGPGANNTYTHDDKLNPFYGVFLIPAPYPSGFVNLANNPSEAVTYFGGTDNVLSLSQNNVLTETPVSDYPGKVTYQYQYNAANLPTVRIKTTTAPPPNAGVTIETLRFEYESY
jgi:hypothetical protein